MNDLQGIEAHAHNVIKCHTRNCRDEAGSIGTAVKSKIENLSLRRRSRINPAHEPVMMKSGVSGRKSKIKIQGRVWRESSVRA